MSCLMFDDCHHEMYLIGWIAFASEYTTAVSDMRRIAILRLGFSAREAVGIAYCVTESSDLPTVASHLVSRAFNVFGM